MSNFVPEKTALGIEFGSTRIKAVLIGPEHTPLAQGDYTWENQLHNGIWTYPLEQVWHGLQSAYAALAADVQQKYGCTLTKVGCIGISAMMHGYLAFDANGELLVPFRTWRNTITGAAAEELTAAFGFNIPQRWSIAHLYQAMLNKEEHLSKLDFFTTLAGYVHWQLTGHKVLGVGDASGMFPIDSTTGGYDAAMLQKFNTMAAAKGYAVGKSLLDESKIDYCKDMMAKAEAKGVKLLLPVDVVVADSFPDPIDGPIDVTTVDAAAIPADKEGLDIGEKTCALFASAVKDAKTVVWNGPMGVFENPTLAKGTIAMAQALADSSATTIVGGGDSAAACEQLGFADKITHISTGGGASLEYLEGKELPGIAVIQNA